MREWFGFVLSNKRILNFGFLFNFFSSFGQTFFISLFVPYFIESIRISSGAFGTVYAVVTVISAFLISMVGKYIDQMPLKKYGLIVFSGLMISVIVLSQVRNIAVLSFNALSLVVSGNLVDRFSGTKLFLFGIFIDNGFSFNWIMAFLAAIVMAVFILSFRIK